MNEVISLEQPRSMAALRDPAETAGVSVIVPAYNAAVTLQRTLNSVLQQTRALWEVIVISDGSTDDTRTIAEEWARRDRRFRVLYQERSGVSAARNRGLREARYPF